MGRLTLSKRTWMLLAFALACAQFAFSLILPPGYLLTAAVDITQTFLLTSVVLATATNISRTSRRARLFWILITLGASAWLVTQLLWTYFEVFLHKSVPNPFVGDVILFLHLVPLMGAMAVRPHRVTDDQTIRLGTIDFSLLFVWWLYLYLFTVIPWQYIAVDVQLYGRNFDILYTLEHIVCLIGIRLVWQQSQGAWKTVYRQLFWASAVYAFASISAGLAIDFGTYYSGGIYDVPLALGMVLFTKVGLTAREHKLENDPVEQTGGTRSVWIARLAMFAALSLPLLAMEVMASHALPASVKSFRLLLTLVAIVVIGTLRSWRQYRLDKALEQAHQNLKEDSLTDLLTGARNRRFFTSAIEGDVQQAIRAYGQGQEHGKRNRDLIFYLIDADCFKEVNDRYGHDLGDRVLVETAKRISSAIRNSDVLIRWGGDEFLVVSRYTDREDAATLAERVLESVGRSLFEFEHHRLQRSCSIGWAVFPWYLDSPDEVPYEEVLQLADAALYEAKSQGRNQAVGMLPARRQSKPLTSESLNSKKETLTERLSAVNIKTKGPTPETSATPADTQARAASASQRQD